MCPRKKVGNPAAESEESQEEGILSVDEASGDEDADDEDYEADEAAAHRKARGGRATARGRGSRGRGRRGAAAPAAAAAGKRKRAADGGGGSTADGGEGAKKSKTKSLQDPPRYVGGEDASSPVGYGNPPRNPNESSRVNLGVLMEDFLQWFQDQ